MPNKRLPYYPMYASDADSDENFRLMTDTQKGFFWRCLNHAWDNEGLPIEHSEIALMFHCDAQYFAEVWERVGRCFEERSGRLINPRQEKEREAAKNKSVKAKRSAKVRWKKEDANALRTHCEGNARASESVSVYKSGSVVGSEEKQDAPILSEPVRSDLSPQQPVAFQRWELDEQYCQFRASYEASGMVPSPADWAEGHASWGALDWEQRLKAIDHARSADGAFIRLPYKYLRFHDWERKARPPAKPASPKEKPMADQLRELGYGD